MSVQSNTYVMVGVMLSPDHFDTVHDDPYEVLEPYMDSAYKGIQHHNGLCVVYGDRHIAIGRVIAKSDDQNGNYGFNTPVDLDEQSTIELRQEVEGLLTEHFSIGEPEVRDLVFTHYR